MNRGKFEEILLGHLKEPQKEKEPLVTACLALYVNIIGDEIAETVSPVNKLSAPFTAAALEVMAKKIRDRFGCDNRFVENIKLFMKGKDVLPKAPAGQKAKAAAPKAGK